MESTKLNLKEHRDHYNILSIFIWPMHHVAKIWPVGAIAVPILQLSKQIMAGGGMWREGPKALEKRYEMRTGWAG